MWFSCYNVSNLSETRKKLRNDATKQEKILWSYLKSSKFLGLKFRRQHSVWRYILDFYCVSRKIWIEIDWIHHDDDKIHVYDNIRTKFLNSAWIYIIRFTNKEIDYDIERVLEKLKDLITNKTS